MEIYIYIRANLTYSKQINFQEPNRKKKWRWRRRGKRLQSRWWRSRISASLTQELMDILPLAPLLWSKISPFLFIPATVAFLSDPMAQVLYRLFVFFFWLVSFLIDHERRVLFIYFLLVAGGTWVYSRNVFLYFWSIFWYIISENSK